MFRFYQRIFIGCLLACVVFVTCMWAMNLGVLNLMTVTGDNTVLARHLMALEMYKADYFDTREADDLKTKVRVMCLILTKPTDLHTKAETIRKTWAKRCNKYFFIVNTKEQAPDLITSDIEESRANLMYKMVHAFKYIYENHMNDFDWILKADDDTYVIVENLRYLLSHYNSSKPGYLGYHFNKYLHNGYMSGGAGYVISKTGFISLVHSLTNTSNTKCELGGQKTLPQRNEDLEIGRCLNITGVPILSSLDGHERETFHPVSVGEYVAGEIPQYLYSWSMNTAHTGPECCSRFTISYHYMKPEAMMLVDHLLYRTSVYGRSLPHNLSNVFKIGHVQHKSHED